jgi:hypothetical protein
MITQIAVTHNITDNWDNVRKGPSNFVRLREALVGADLDATNNYPRFQMPVTFQTTGTSVTKAPITVNQDVDGISIDIDSEATTADVINIAPTTLTTGNVIDVADANSLTTGSIMNAVSNSSSNAVRTLVQITNDNTAATETVPLTIQQDAAADLGGESNWSSTTTPASGGTLVPNTCARYLKVMSGATAGFIPIYGAI